VPGVQSSATSSGRVSVGESSGGTPTITHGACDPSAAQTAAVIDGVLAPPDSGYALQTVHGTTLTIESPGRGMLTYQWVPPAGDGTDPANLINRSWHLLSVAGAPVATDVTLRIDLDQHVQGHMSGLDGCHTISTWATVHRAWWTALAPLDDAAPQRCGTSIHRILATNPVLWSIQDGRLVVRAADMPQAAALVYGTAPRPGTDPGLVGPTWTEAAMESSGAGAPAVNGAYRETSQLRIDSGGGVTIMHRCYANRGDVTIGAGTLDISGVHLLRAIPCPATGAQGAEQAMDAFFDRTVSGRVSWSISGGELHVTKGGTTYDFRR
jgi:hypothetical protein